METRKILIATPIRGGASSSYFAGLLPVIQTKFPGVVLEHVILEGPSINFARNECAHYAMAIKAREIVFVDEDMQWTVGHFERLISHRDIDIVGGPYCKRRPGLPFWLINLKKGCEIDPATNLCEVEDIATGFMKIRVDTVFAEMMEKFPEREFYNKPEEGKPVTAWEFFPMGVFGPRSAEARLEKIKGLLTNKKFWNAEEALIDRIRDAVEEPHQPGTLLGEDYGFCELARRCGFKIFADFGMAPVPHIGKVAFPITPEMVGLDPAKILAMHGEKA